MGVLLKHMSKLVLKPSQSPDLNPIKNQWNVLKRQFDARKPTNWVELC